ncbi:MAG TPA: hypothetical protein VD929_00935 [Caulobacteraceae bacterium]|nr:hypothetical protein [Caulobacteraceae bacterium]
MRRLVSALVLAGALSAGGVAYAASKGADQLAAKVSTAAKKAERTARTQGAGEAQVQASVEAAALKVVAASGAPAETVKTALTSAAAAAGSPAEAAGLKKAGGEVQAPSGAGRPKPKPPRPPRGCSGPGYRRGQC